MKRIVPIIVDDDRITECSVEWRGEDGHRGESAYHVPLDDQLTRDVDTVTNLLDHGEVERGAAMARLRAAFGLDEEGGDEQ